jgi:hypothetical protein
MRVLSCIGAGLLAGCSQTEPVLSGIPEAPILAELGSGDEQNDKKRPKGQYIKAADVYVDIRHIGGQQFDQIRDIIDDQMGPLQNRRVVSEIDGEELQFIRGTIRVVNGRVYMVRIPLTQPLRRTEALQSAGFPPFTKSVIRSHREFRLNHEWGFRRLRLRRVGADDERVTHVEAWKWLPRERQNGR